MRVISGSKRGLRLKAPKTKLRPLTDRVKEALFNILQNHISGSSFLDLFAGSGAVGIEALSRGAKIAFFVDHDRECVRTILDNLKTTDFLNNSEVFGLDVIKALNVLATKGARFDIIYLGAPYGSPALKKALDNIGISGLLNDKGLVIAEHRTKEAVESKYGKLSKEKDYKYGDTTLAFYNYGDEN